MRELLNSITHFKGIYLSGFFISNPATVTALSLLFENIHLPNQLEILLEFAKSYDLQLKKTSSIINIKIGEGEDGDKEMFDGLTPRQQETAKLYLLQSHIFVSKNHELFPQVFTTEMVKETKPFKLELLEKGGDGNRYKYQGSFNAEISSQGIDEIIPK